MPIERLRKHLDESGTRYVTIRHSPAFTAQEIAASTHIPGEDVAKVVVVRLDGRTAMAVIPATCRLDLSLLRRAANVREARLATEEEFRDLFPGCEVGAMPPFGGLFGMDVYVATVLTEDEDIAFNAGTHVEVILMKYADYARVAQPKVVDLTAPVAAVR